MDSTLGCRMKSLRKGIEVGVLNHERIGIPISPLVVRKLAPLKKQDIILHRPEPLSLLPKAHVSNSFANCNNLEKLSHSDTSLFHLKKINNSTENPTNLNVAATPFEAQQ